MLADVATSDYYLARGLRQIGTALPVKLVVEFDRKVAEIPFRSRNSMIAEALSRFLECPAADWQAGDHPSSNRALNPVDLSMPSGLIEGFCDRPTSWPMPPLLVISMLRLSTVFGGGLFASPLDVSDETRIGFGWRRGWKFRLLWIG